MRICKHDEQEEKQTAAVLSPLESPVLLATDDSEDDEAQWDAYLAKLMLHQDSECGGGCDWTEGALSSDGCRW